MAGLVAIAGVMLTFIATSNQLDKGPKSKLLEEAYKFATKKESQKPRLLKKGGSGKDSRSRKTG